MRVFQSGREHYQGFETRRLTTTLYIGQTLQLLAADGAHIFFTESGNLKSIPAGGGTPQTLGNGVSVVAAVSDGTYLYWASSAGTVYRLTL